MQANRFKGLATDRFIGVSEGSVAFPESQNRRAYKEVFEIGLFHSWAVQWCPVEELPEDFHEKVKEWAPRNSE